MYYRVYNELEKARFVEQAAPDFYRDEDLEDVIQFGLVFQFRDSDIIFFRDAEIGESLIYAEGAFTRQLPDSILLEIEQILDMEIDRVGYSYTAAFGSQDYETVYAVDRTHARLSMYRNNGFGFDQVWLEEQDGETYLEFAADVPQTMVTLMPRYIYSLTEEGATQFLDGMHRWFIGVSKRDAAAQFRLEVIGELGRENAPASIDEAEKFLTMIQQVSVRFMHYRLNHPVMADEDRV